ncbi:MAG: hypothetical protein A2Z51_08930 [Deltaproteobacteria bacterium RBG_19FT_COMBO_52_11]|nr:MAG: hypothetical protein A2Z51_08930 [Deltaproteobacteria bacterium RBG_19FT_COMBO_52_11]
MVDHTNLLVARAKEQAPKTKRAGIKPSHFPPSSFPQRDAGGKGSLGNKAQKPALGKEGPPPFLARRMLFYPGMEPLGHTESLLSIEPIQNTAFSERKRAFFSTKLEMA